MCQSIQLIRFSIGLTFFFVPHVPVTNVVSFPLTSPTNFNIAECVRVLNRPHSHHPTLILHPKRMVRFMSRLEMAVSNRCTIDPCKDSTLPTRSLRIHYSTSSIKILPQGTGTRLLENITHPRCEAVYFALRFEYLEGDRNDAGTRCTNVIAASKQWAFGGR